jgi:hypothetical protein
MKCPEWADLAVCPFFKKSPAIKPFIYKTLKEI